MTATLYWKLSAIEHWEHLAAETWKQQVQQITRWTKGQSARKVVQVAMLAQALRLRGCVEDSPESSTVGQDPWTQMLMTLIVLVVLGACNFLYGHWRVISEIFARRGRKRRREPEIPVSEPEIPASEMNVETTESEGPAGEPASASTGPVLYLHRPHHQEDHLREPHSFHQFPLTHLQGGIRGCRSGSCTLCLEG